MRTVSTDSETNFSVRYQHCIHKNASSTRVLRMRGVADPTLVRVQSRLCLKFTYALNYEPTWHERYV